MEMQNNSFSDSQKESCALEIMRDAISELSARDNISYEDALYLFASSKVYDALFDFETGIWRESADYLLNLYDYCSTSISNK